MRRLMRSAAWLLVFVMGVWQPAALTWGEDGHLWINRVAAQKVPKTMPLFFRQAVDRLSYLGPEPDRWRNQNSEPQLKYSQEADHFFDTEALPADFGPLPGDRYKYIKQLYEARQKLLAAGATEKKADELLPERVGLQPYITMEVLGRLRVAFRDYRHLKAAHKPTLLVEGNIITYAGWLGHYVADGSQPLHVTVNYNGWKQAENPNGYTTKPGIHSDFETRFVHENMKPADFAPRVKAPEQLKDPWMDYQAYLKDSLGQVERVYQLEKAGGFAGKGSPEAREFTKQRLAAGSQMLLDLWYTAWMESAVDPPDPYRQANPAPAAKPVKK